MSNGQRAGMSYEAYAPEYSRIIFRRISLILNFEFCILN